MSIIGNFVQDFSFALPYGFLLTREISFKPHITKSFKERVHPFHNRYNQICYINRFIRIIVNLAPQSQPWPFLEFCNTSLRQGSKIFRKSIFRLKIHGCMSKVRLYLWVKFVPFTYCNCICFTSPRKHTAKEQM